MPYILFSTCMSRYELTSLRPHAVAWIAGSRLAIPYTHAWKLRGTLVTWINPYTDPPGRVGYGYGYVDIVTRSTRRTQVFSSAISRNASRIYQSTLHAYIRGWVPQVPKLPRYFRKTIPAVPEVPGYLSGKILPEYCGYFSMPHTGPGSCERTEI